MAYRPSAPVMPSLGAVATASATGRGFDKRTRRQYAPE
jgi:hypothetical protein